MARQQTMADTARAESVTVVLTTDPETGDVDPSAPALFYSRKGYFIGSRALRRAELDLLGGRRSADLAVPAPVAAAI